MKDNIKKMKEEMVDKHEEWNGLVETNKSVWLSDFKRLLGKNEMFWGTTFSTFLMFKVFEHAFSGAIDECYVEAKEESPKENLTRTEVAYALFGSVIERGDLMADIDNGAQA